jgi:hypothetical protein
MSEQVLTAVALMLPFVLLVLAVVIGHVVGEWLR